MNVKMMLDAMQEISDDFLLESEMEGKENDNTLLRQVIYGVCGVLAIILVLYIAMNNVKNNKRKEDPHSPVASSEENTYDKTQEQSIETSVEATTQEATTQEATTQEATTQEATTQEATTQEATTQEATTQEATEEQYNWLDVLYEDSVMYVPLEGAVEKDGIWYNKVYDAFMSSKDVTLYEDRNLEGNEVVIPAYMPMFFSGSDRMEWLYFENTDASICGWYHDTRNDSDLYRKFDVTGINVGGYADSLNNISPENPLVQKLQIGTASMSQFKDISELLAVLDRPEVLETEPELQRTCDWLKKCSPGTAVLICYKSDKKPEWTYINEAGEQGALIQYWYDAKNNDAGALYAGVYIALHRFENVALNEVKFMEFALPDPYK